MKESDKDISQDLLIQSNAERIAKNEAALARQTEALEQIRDHYYPLKTPWQRASRFVVKVVCVIVAYLGIAETVDWIWTTHESKALAYEFAENAYRLFFEEGNAVGAARCYEKAIELDGEESDYRIALAFVKGMTIGSSVTGMDRPLTDAELESISLAQTEALVFRRQKPDSPLSYVLMAQSLILLGERREALEEIEHSVACDPTEPAFRIRACAISSMAGDFERARRHLAEAERLDASFPLIPIWKGFLKLNVDHDAAAAAACFREVVRRTPRLPFGHAFLGRALLAAKAPDISAARAAFQKSLSLQPSNPFATLGMAETYEKEGKFSIARIWLDRAIAKDENNVSARFARARVRGKLGDRDGAIADLTAIAELAPLRADVYRLRAEAYEQAGDAKRAAADRQTASELADKKQN